MTDKEQDLYWRGIYFPGTLTVEELEKWCEIKSRSERPLDYYEQETWSFLFGLWVVFLCIAAFVM